MDTISIVIALGAVALALGWGVAWYFASPEPALAPMTPGRITYKMVVQGFFRDVADVTRPVWKWVWLNMPFGATLVLDAVSMMTPQLRQVLWVDSPIGGAAVILLTLLVRYGSTAAHAPVQAPR